MRKNKVIYNENCTACPRLSAFLINNKKQYPDYHAKPVAPFGEAKPKLLIVGLAPGMHGANATGRPFTGDYAGVLLYETLYKFGFSNQPESTNINDGLILKDCRITNAVKCLPPENKPIGEEINTCNIYLEEELKQINKNGMVLCLGLIAHKAVIKALGYKQRDYAFGHGRFYKMDNGITLADSYHCSRYNTQTRRLTEDMFHDVFRTIKQKLK